MSHFDLKHHGDATAEQSALPDTDHSYEVSVQWTCECQSSEVALSLLQLLMDSVPIARRLCGELCMRTVERKTRVRHIS